MDPAATRVLATWALILASEREYYRSPAAIASAIALGDAIILTV